jgi:histone H3/H4
MAKKAKKGGALVVVASRVKEVVKAKGLRSDGALAEAVNEKVICLIEAAAKRCQGNKRGTVRPYDL